MLEKDVHLVKRFWWNNERFWVIIETDGFDLICYI